MNYQPCVLFARRQRILAHGHYDAYTLNGLYIMSASGPIGLMLYQLKQKGFEPVSPNSTIFAAFCYQFPFVVNH